MLNGRLLDDAIADAKAVRAMAIANAKTALEDAFAQRFSDMLSQDSQDLKEEYDPFAHKKLQSIRTHISDE